MFFIPDVFMDNWKSSLDLFLSNQNNGNENDYGKRFSCY